MDSDKEDSNKDLWWIASSGKHLGPFAIEELETRIKSGDLKADTLVCSVNGDQWIEAAKCEALKEAFQTSERQSESANLHPPTLEGFGGYSRSTQTQRMTFRYLLIAEISLFVTSLILAIIGLFLVGQYSPALETSEVFTIADGISVASALLFLIVLLPAQVVAWVGLFKLRNWARWLHLGVFAFCSLVFLVAGISDFSVTWALPGSVHEIGYVCTGAILALAFLSPLADQFQASESV